VAKAHGWGDYDAEIMDTQTPQVSSRTSSEPMAATILQSSILRSFRTRAINWSCSDRLFPPKTTVGAPNQRQRFVELFPALAQALVKNPGIMAGSPDAHVFQERKSHGLSNRYFLRSRCYGHFVHCCRCLSSLQVQS
jgi:hypothetical protein